ncbi:hypothetical protein CASFOL_037764 [Castilleja foliolosa]|uniref:Uncharacterized protein n=1 Tax=Castilleja foliolosa TaxID=1961234 RepID=A0ABD3BJ29_9LAMI
MFILSLFLGMQGPYCHFILLTLSVFLRVYLDGENSDLQKVPILEVLASMLDSHKNSVLASTVYGTSDAKLKEKEPDPSDPIMVHLLNGNAEQNTELNPSSTELHCQPEEGESTPQERQVSHDKLYRAALLRSRFADIIIKAQENSIDKGEKPDPERLKREKDKLEKQRKEASSNPLEQLGLYMKNEEEEEEVEPQSNLDASNDPEGEID